MSPAPLKHTELRAIASKLLDPKSPGVNNHCSGACTAVSSQTDAYAVSSGKADTEHDTSKEDPTRGWIDEPHTGHCSTTESFPLTWLKTQMLQCVGNGLPAQQVSDGRLCLLPGPVLSLPTAGCLL